MLAADDRVVRVSDDDKVASRVPLTPRMDPEIVYVMKIDIRQQWRDDRALWRSFQRIRPLALFQHARLQPFLDQANDPGVADPMLHEPDQPIVADRIEERTDISVQNPQDIASLDTVPERVP